MALLKHVFPSLTYLYSPRQELSSSVTCEQWPLLAPLPKGLAPEAQRMEGGALVAVSMRRDSSRCSGGVSSEASAMASAPLFCPPPAVSRVLEEQPQVRGQEVAGPAGYPQGHGIFIWRRFHMPRLEWK